MKGNRTIRTLSIGTAAIAMIVAWQARAGETEGVKIPEDGPFLGVFVQSVSPVVTAQLGLQPDVGVVLEFVSPGSPADEAGLQQYDILLKYDDQLLIGSKQIVVLVRNSEIGSEHAITYIRGGKEAVATVTIGAANQEHKQRLMDFQKEDEHSMNWTPQRAPMPPAPSIAPRPPDVERFRIRDVDGNRRTIIMNPELDYAGRVEMNENMDTIIESVRRAADDPMGVRMPTFVYRGESRVFDFVDEKGIRYSIIEENGERSLTIWDESNSRIYAGPLDDAAMEKLPESIQKSLPRIQRVAMSEAPALAPDRAAESF